jgi:4-amino-4-deoxy-L-arabinose transferase-like glycosyltransferase
VPGPGIAARPLRTPLAPIAIVVLAGACMLPGLAAPWVGHHDWNGALWSLFARNFLRYGYADLHFGHAYFAGPLPEQVWYYTHHSPLITIVLTELYRVFGIHEAVARTAAVAAALVAAGLFYVLVRDYFDEATAVAALVVYALCPMHLYFGRMYNHEVFALLGILLCLHAYRRWARSGSRAALAAVASSLALATATAWPAYYLAALLPLHHRFTAVGPRRTGTLLATLLGVSLLTFGVFLAHGYWLAGGELFSELLANVHKAWFSNQLDWGPEFTNAEFFREEMTRSLSLFTRPAVALAALGATYTLGTAAIERRLDAAAGLLALLLAFGIAHVLLFRQDAMVHDYYLYYLLPGTALAAGVAIRSIAAARVRPLYRWMTLCVLAVWFVVASARTTRAVHRDVMQERRRDVELGRWIHDHADFATPVLLNFEAEGPFVVFYADRDVVESLETVEAFERRRNAPALVVLRRGRTPQVEAWVSERYGGEAVALDGETVLVARLPAPAGAANGAQ